MAKKMNQDTTGEPQQVMFVIGAFADEGEDCLLRFDR